MLLSLLKRETRPSHDRIEQSPRLSRLLEADLTRDEYREVLERHYGFLAPVEARLGALPDWDRIGFSFDERRRAPLLRRDLVRLGLSGADVDGLPVCTDLPGVGTLPRAIGCLYVLEGSTLGGRIIARHLRQSLGIDAASGAAFYEGFGDETGPRWKAFGAMSVAATHPDDYPAVVAAAGETFDTMTVWMER